MPYSRIEKMKKDKRTKIMESSLQEFTSKRFELASINQISKNAGLSAGALYYYFENKEDLFYTTIEYAIKEMFHDIEHLDKMFRKSGYWQAIEEIVERRLVFTKSHPKHTQLFHRVLTSNDPIEAKGRRDMIKPFRAIFEYGYENGYIRKDLPKDLVFSLHFSMIIEVNRWTLNQQLVDGNDAYDYASLSQKTISMIRSAVGKDQQYV